VDFYAHWKDCSIFIGGGDCKYRLLLLPCTLLRYTLFGIDL
jgi:hypothetical protein